MTVAVTLALAVSCVADPTGEVADPAKDPVWEYTVEVEHFRSSYLSETWRARIDRGGVLTVEVEWEREWFPFEAVQLSDDRLDRIAGAVEENGFWQLPDQITAGLMTSHSPITALTVRDRDRQHEVTIFATHPGISEEGDRSLRILEEILPVIPDPNDRPDPPAAFGTVIRVEADRIAIRLSEDSPALTEPGPRFAVYKDDTYKSDAMVVEIRGRVMLCKPAVARVKIEVGDSASIYLQRPEPR